MARVRPRVFGERAKAAEWLDVEARGPGLRVYALCPGAVATDRQVQYSGARAGMPPEEVARRILELATAKRGARTEHGAGRSPADRGPSWAAA